MNFIYCVTKQYKLNFKCNAFVCLCMCLYVRKVKCYKNCIKNSRNSRYREDQGSSFVLRKLKVTTLILILFAQFIQISLSQTMTPACIPVMDIWRISLLKMIIKCLNLDVQCCYTNLSALPWGLFISSFDSCHEASIIWFLLWNNQTNGLNAL